MEKEFIPHKEAKALKKLGFDEKCIAIYEGMEDKTFVAHYVTHPYFTKEQLEDKKLRPALYADQDTRNSKLPQWGISAPLYQQAFAWFRDEHNMLANVYSNASGFLFEYHDTVGGTHRYDSDISGPNDSGCWDEYKDAELECIKFLIKTVKK